MPHFTQIDNIEDFFAQMNEAEEQANARTSPRGRKHIEYAATHPTWWFRVTLDEPEGLLIAGRSQTIEEQVAKEVELGGLEDRPEEDIRSDFTNKNERGYLFGKCHSKIVPEGELGSTHVSEVFWCDESTFEKIKDADWCLHSLLETDIPRGVELATTMNGFAELDSDPEGGQIP